MKKKKEYDVIVVGSGAGGAPVAKKLAEKGKEVLIIEAGPHIHDAHIGKFFPMVFHPGHYNRWAAFSMSKEMTTVYHTKNVGGTTVVACGNMVRACEKEFKKIGIDLSKHYKEAEKDITITPVPENKIVSGTKKIMEAAQTVGVNMVPMPKGTNPGKSCNVCGDCVLGCHTGHKWDARSYLSQAVNHGAQILASTKVKRVLQSMGNFYGVETDKGDVYYANQIVLSAGGLNTPVILLNSGVDAGFELFIDPFNVTAGVIPRSTKLTQLVGASMGAVCTDYHYSDGFILSPFIDHYSQFALWNRPFWNLGHLFPLKRVLSIMTKITDENVGRVFRDGSFSKKLTTQDKGRLGAGANLSIGILEAADASSIVTTKHARGAHPGGAAAIGHVLNNDLSVKGANGTLYVCDASIFPFTPGKPPMLDITAFGLRLGDHIK